MNVLLDTHALLWWLADDPALSSEARRVIGEASNQVFVSPVTPWEIAIKASLGKLKAPDGLLDAIAANCFSELPISLAHAEVAGNLPQHHRDPFDRMLIAQALTEGLTLVSRDRIFERYGVAVLRV